MKAILALAVSALAVLVVAPVAGAQDAGIRNPEASTPTTLFFHINGFQDFPINTQQPDDSFAASENVGLQTHSLSCIGDQTGQFGILESEWHTFYGYSSPSYVEYNFTEDGKPRTHPERGLSFDALLDTAKPWTVWWYLETAPVQNDNGNVPADPNTVPLIVPQVTLQATVRTGDAISVNDAGYNSGDYIAQGRAGPYVLTPAGDPQHPEMTYQSINGRNVYGFPIVMDIQMDTIPKATGYNVRIDAFLDNPYCGDPATSYFMPNVVRVHTSPEARPRMELSTLNPIRIEYLHPQFLADDMVIHTAMNSPWGNYDVDETEGGIELTVTGPSPATSLNRAAIHQRTHIHYFHQVAVDVTYVWPYKEDQAQSGLYTVGLKVWNDQRTAQAFATAQFEIGSGAVVGCGGLTGDNLDCVQDVQPDGSGDDRGSPGAGLLAVLGALAAAVAVLRRRA
ncbi:MAG TPA: hypothetical protein VI796_05850 [Candidatus Thermoplasmatota archaeon]|nr:hypothetical protein [Candidatus Thermoplasmatota archaeon]